MTVWNAVNAGKWMRFGRWNVKGQHRSGPLQTLARELARYRIIMVGVQEIKCDTGGIE